MAVVLSVGSCSADDYRMGRVVRAELGAEMESVGTAEEGMRAVAEKKFDLVLVNRVLDWDGTLGVDFISAAKKAGVASPMLLVSDYAEAQVEAEAVGAMPGFGKRGLGEARVGELLRGAMGVNK